MTQCRVVQSPLAAAVAWLSRVHPNPALKSPHCFHHWQLVSGAEVCFGNPPPQTKQNGSVICKPAEQYTILEFKRKFFLSSNCPESPLNLTSVMARILHFLGGGRHHAALLDWIISHMTHLQDAVGVDPSSLAFLTPWASASAPEPRRVESQSRCLKWPMDDV